MVFSVSDFIFDICLKGSALEELGEEFYSLTSNKTDCVINVTRDEVDDIQSRDETMKKMFKTHVGVLLTLCKISDWLPLNNAFMLHAAVFDINGTGIAFSALSGTGKSTHLANWYAYLNGTKNMPDKITKLYNKNIIIDKDKNLPELKIVNGDKPFVRFFDNEFCKNNGFRIPKDTEIGIPYAYGTPWNGKENLGCNMRTPLKHICFIERSDTNYVTKIENIEAVNRIMQQVHMPKDPVALTKTLELVNRLISCCDLWIIHCNMDIESAKVAYKAIFEGSRK